MFAQIGIVLGVLGFGLSVGLAVLDIQRRRKRLRLFVTPWELAGDSKVSEANSRVLLLRLSLVNAASIPRTVFNLRFEEPGGIYLEAINGVPDYSTNTYSFRSESAPGWSIEMPAKDVAIWPLDVEPQRSVTRFLLVTVRSLPANQGQSEQAPILLLAEDVHGRNLAKAELVLETPE